MIRQIFTACFLGSVVGGIVGLQLNPFLWGWVNLLIGMGAGALVGYISYDIRQVVETTSIAWRRAMGWTPNKDYWRASLWSLFGFTCSFTNINLLFLPVFYFSPPNPALKASFQTWFFGPLVIEMVVLFLAACMSQLAISAGSVRCEDQLEKYHEAEKAGRFLARHANPFSVFLWYIPRFGIMCIVWPLRQIPKLPDLLVRFFQAVYTFGWLVFIAIHSEGRLTCALGAGIGAGAIYLTTDFSFNILIGGFVGGIVGVLDYQLVSVRWLKLQPKSRLTQA